MNKLKTSVVAAVMIATVSCGAKTGLREPIIEGPRVVSCSDTLTACTTTPVVVSSSMLPASSDVAVNLNGNSIPSRFTSSVVSGVATATLEFGTSIRVDAFSPDNRVSFVDPGPNPNYLESPFVISADPSLVRLSFGANSRPISLGDERVYKCLRFRVMEGSDSDTVRFGVIDSNNQNLGSGSLPVGSTVPFSVDNQSVLLANYQPAAADRFGLVLFTRIVDIPANGPIRVNGRPQLSIRGSITSEGDSVTGFSVEIRDGSFTNCQ